MAAVEACGDEAMSHGLPRCGAEGMRCVTEVAAVDVVAWRCGPEEGYSETSTDGCNSDDLTSEEEFSTSSEASRRVSGAESEATQAATEAEPLEGAEARAAEMTVDIVAEEDRLTKEVPKLLDTMNRASEEVNSLERQANTAQARYRMSVAECSKFYGELRAKNGPEFDKVKPYFSAVQEVKAASHRMQIIASEFAIVGGRTDEAIAAGRSDSDIAVLAQERDRLEAAYVCALREHRAAEQALERQRNALGESAIRRAQPAFELLQQRQLKLAVEYNRMNSLSERARHSKGTYQQSMRELERISTAVHDIRRSRGQRGASPSAADAVSA
mmetsp:Transcript_68556/g.198948  ORF Transcript_68556/g.198948 Transcript_68556/m.198948 type:complete len:329 (+) Transcript_68556:67-1053(+)